MGLVVLVAPTITLWSAQMLVATWPKREQAWGTKWLSLEAPAVAKGRGSAGRCSPGLGGGFSAVRVQSRWQEGAERDGCICKPIGSWRSQEGRGKGAACLVIALINQARSEQDPTLSTPCSGLCHPQQRQVLCHPPPQQCHHSLLSPASQWDHPARSAPKGFPHPHQTARVTSGVTLAVQPSDLMTFWRGTEQSHAGSLLLVPSDAQGYRQGPHVLSINAVDTGQHPNHRAARTLLCSAGPGKVVCVGSGPRAFAQPVSK